jgi:hypothetical protein
MISKKSGKQSNIWLTCSHDRETTSFGTALALMKTSMGGLCFLISTEDLTGSRSMGCKDFLIFITTVLSITIV